MSTLDARIAARWPYGGDEVELTEKLLSVPTMRSRIALVVVSCLIFPIARELYFRGVLFGELRRTTSTRVATLTTAVFFASYPGDLREIPSRLVLGIALAILRIRTGTVVAAIVGHVAFWSIEGIFILRGHDPAVDIAYPARWIVGGAAIAVLALVGVGAGRKEG